MTQHRKIIGDRQREESVLRVLNEEWSTWPEGVAQGHGFNEIARLAGTGKRTSGILKTLVARGIVRREAGGKYHVTVSPAYLAWLFGVWAEHVARERRRGTLEAEAEDGSGV
jgi:DNA-binding IclR family transcriptional regulator